MDKAPPPLAYEKMEFSIFGLEPKHWQNSKSLEDAAAGSHISEEKLMELVDAEIVPHLRVNGSPPRFNLKILKDWVEAYLVNLCPGEELPLVKVQNVMAQGSMARYGRVPEELRAIIGLRNAGVGTKSCGVYFLCRGTKCVYVGKATVIMNRIGSHSDKNFDRAYYIPVDEVNLSTVEVQMIKALAPEYNNCVVAKKAKRAKKAKNTTDNPSE